MKDSTKTEFIYNILPDNKEEISGITLAGDFVAEHEYGLDDILEEYETNPKKNGFDRYLLSNPELKHLGF